jgi:uncharacterized membrane protein
MDKSPLTYFILAVAAFVFIALMLVMNSQAALHDQGRLPDQNETSTPGYSKFVEQQGVRTGGIEIRFSWMVMLGFIIVMVFAAIAIFIRSLFGKGKGTKGGGWG